jgi:hypothetical protein
MLKQIFLAILISLLPVTQAVSGPIIDNDGKVIQPDKPFSRIWF